MTLKCWRVVVMGMVAKTAAYESDELYCKSKR